MEVVKIPKKRAILTVNFKGVERFVPSSVAGGFEVAERTIRETGEERARIVDADFFDFAGEGMFAFFDEGFSDCSDAAHAAVKPNGRVYTVSKEIAGHAASRNFHVEPP